MFYYHCSRIALIMMAAALLFGQSSPTYAQDDTTATEPFTVTQSLTSAAATGLLDTEDAPIMAAEAKTDLQESELLVPDPAGGGVTEDLKSFLYLPLVSTLGDAQAEAEAAATTAYWRAIKYEGFEGIWPGAGWRTYDCNGGVNGEYYWDDDDYKPYTGGWSAWPANGGLNAVDPQYRYYANNMCAWMVYGPFSLRYAQNARLTFKYWQQSEIDYDWLSWMVSCDGYNFNGWRESGDTSGWRTGSLSLNACRGDSTVWIAFRFTSDFSNTRRGPFVDNVLIEEYR